MSRTFIKRFGKGWYSFDDLDTFNLEPLIVGLNVPINEKSVWSRSMNIEDNKKGSSDCGISLNSRRQMEAMFNLGQLLINIYLGRCEGQTLRDAFISRTRYIDLAFENPSIESQFEIINKICKSIVKSGGFDVIAKMIRNPMFPRVRLSAVVLLSVMVTNNEVALRIAHEETWILAKVMKWLKNPHSSLEFKVNLLRLLSTFNGFMMAAKLESEKKWWFDMIKHEMFIDGLVSTLSYHLDRITNSSISLQDFVFYEIYVFRLLGDIFHSKHCFETMTAFTLEHLVEYIFLILQYSSSGLAPCDGINHIKHAKLNNLPDCTPYALVVLLFVICYSRNQRLRISRSQFASGLFNEILKSHEKKMMTNADLAITRGLRCIIKQCLLREQRITRRKDKKNSLKRAFHKVRQYEFSEADKENLRYEFI